MLGQTYVEPFAGGAGLALKLLLNGDVKRIVINDFDISIYAFWKSVLFDTEAFCHKIQGTNVNQKEWVHQRTIYNSNTSNLLELGFSAFYLNRTNVSGIISGGIIGGQEQQGRYKIDARYNKEALINKIQTIASYKEQITVLNCDTKELLQSNALRRYYKAFINFDPPYVSKGSKLYKNYFTDNDHKELCHLISKCKRKWIVTYDICPLVWELYHKYRSSYLDITYSVQRSQKAKEYIFFSNNLIIPPNIELIK